MKRTSVCAQTPGGRFHRFARAFALFGSLAMLVAWGLPASADTAPRRPAGKRLLLFVGSNTLGERALPELAKAYLEREKKVGTATIQSGSELSYVAGELPDGPAVYIEIHATGSGDCFKSFAGFFTGADAPCDIGMSSRRIYENEAAALLQKLGSDFTQHGSEPGRGCEHPIAMDGLAIVVHQSNPLSRISFSQLQAIYSRKTLSWNQLPEWKAAGGAGEAPILPVRRKEPSGTLDFFKERISPDPAPMSDEKAIAAFTSSEGLAARVAATPGGIGFVGQGYALAAGLKRLQVYDDSSKGMMSPEDAVFPDPAAVHKGIYPLSRYLFLYTPSISLNPEVQPFIKFALSEEGQTVIADKGNLLKIEGTQLHITKKEPIDATAAASPAGPTLRSKEKGDPPAARLQHGRRGVRGESRFQLFRREEARGRAASDRGSHGRARDPRRARRRSPTMSCAISMATGPGRRSRSGRPGRAMPFGIWPAGSAISACLRGRSRTPSAGISCPCAAI